MGIFHPSPEIYVIVSPYVGVLGFSSSLTQEKRIHHNHRQVITISKLNKAATAQRETKVMFLSADQSQIG